jgi:hypothetical protein
VFDLLEGFERGFPFIDKKRKKLSFIDENKQMIIDHKGDLLTQRLGNNLQNTYLKGINHLITNVLDTRQCPNWGIPP